MISPAPDRPVASVSARPPNSIVLRQILEAIARWQPHDHLPSVELTTAAHLVRPAPWQFDHRVTSLFSTSYVRLAIQAVTLINQLFSGARIGQTDVRDRPRFEVLVPSKAAAEINHWLSDLWTTAHDQIAAGGVTSQRVAAARAMWRAALLVSSDRGRRAEVRVCVPLGSPVVDALDRAATVLGLTLRRQRRSSRWLLTVDSPLQVARMLRAMGAGPHAEAWAFARTRRP